MPQFFLTGHAYLTHSNLFLMGHAYLTHYQEDFR